MLRPLPSISASECYLVNGISTARSLFHSVLQMVTLSDLVWYTVFQQLQTVFQPVTSMLITTTVTVQVGSLTKTLRETWLLTHLRMVCLPLKGSGLKIMSIQFSQPKCHSWLVPSTSIDLAILQVPYSYQLEFHWKLNLPSTTVRMRQHYHLSTSLLVLLSNRVISSR